MNILWITNGLLPEATAKLSGQKEIKGTGSWILGLAEEICKKNVSLFIVGITSNVKELTVIKGLKIQAVDTMIKEWSPVVAASNFLELANHALNNTLYEYKRNNGPASWD